MKVTIDITDENDSDARMSLIDTENLNFVRLVFKDTFYYVSIADLYRATMPFMDLRQENKDDR